MYDIDRIFKEFESKNPQETLNTEFIVERIRELPNSSRSILAWASFLGNSFSFDWIVRLMSGEFDFDEHCPVKSTTITNRIRLSHPKMDAIEGLQAAIEAGVINSTEDDDRFRFAHDRYVQASKSLEACHEKKMHYIIARTLIAHYKCDLRTLELAAPHICDAVYLIKSWVKQRQPYRKVLIDYATSLIEKNARPAAATYYRAAIELLQADPWDDIEDDAYYDETLQLYIRSADCHLAIGRFDEAKQMIAMVLGHGRTVVDQAFCFVLQSRIDRHECNSSAVFRALEICLERLSVQIPNRTTLEACDVAYHDIMSQIAKIDKKDLVRRQPMTKASGFDVETIGAIIAEADRASFWSSPLDFYRMTLLHVEIHLKYGGHTETCFGFMHLAMITIARFNDCRAGYELGLLALELTEEWGGSDINWRALTAYSMFIGHIYRPIRPHLELLEAELETSLTQGDRPAVIVTFGMVGFLKFFAGHEISEIEAFCAYGCQEVDNWQLDTQGAPLTMAVRQMCRSLMGKTSTNPAHILSDDSHDSPAFKQSLSRINLDGDRPLFYYECCEIVPLFLYGHFKQAIEIGTVGLQRADAAWSSRQSRFIMFIHALSMVGLFWKDSQDAARAQSPLFDHAVQRQRTIDGLKHFQSKIEDWQVVSDVNYLMWSKLLSSQVAELERNHARALLDMEEALDHASVQDFILEEAIGYSLLASLFIRAGSRRPAKAALRDSIALYHQLGAWGVATHLEEEHHLLLQEPTKNLRSIDVGVQTDIIESVVSYQALEEHNVHDGPQHGALEEFTERSAQQAPMSSESMAAWQLKGLRSEPGSGLPALDMLDLTAIIESSQVMSSVLKVDELLKTMCEIIMQNCGGLATLIAIITNDDNGNSHSIAASADQDKGAVAHIPGIPLRESACIAENVVLYTSRFREVVFVTELNEDERFSNVRKSWLELNPMGRSVIALPIMRGEHPMGVLYIEGLPNAFSDRNLTVLQLLVNQVGISLSNAMIMKEVEKISAFNTSMVEIQRAALNKALLAEGKAKAAKAAAEEAAKAKSIFLANVSHELRTPLNGVIGNSELLKDSNLRKDQAEMADSIRFSADLLLTVINDLLDFSKMEADKMKLFVVAFNADEMMREVVRSVAYSNRDKKAQGVEILHHIDLPKYLVFGDPVRLHQVLGNLISNSLKFTEKGSITVSAKTDWESRDAVKLTFSVRDTGLGIPANELEKLFKPFSQADAKTNRKHGGSGLGLSICKSLIETMMGGTIALESNEGQGTVCWFTVVLTKAKSDTYAGDSQLELLNHDHEENHTPTLGTNKPTVSTGITKFSIPRDQMRVAIAEE